MKPAFQCHECGFRFRTDEKYVGRTVRCPNQNCARPVLLVSQAEPRPRQPPPPVAPPPAPPEFQASGRNVRPAAPVPAPPIPTPANRRLERTRQIAAKLQSPKSASAAGGARFGKLFVAGAFLCAMLAAAAAFTWQPLSNVIFAGTNPTAADPAAGPASAAAAKLGEPVLTAAQIAAQAAAADERRRQDAIDQTLNPWLKKHCYECHGPDVQEAGLEVHDLQHPADFFRDHSRWERVYRMINAGAMPPAGHDPMPDKQSQEQIAKLLHDELYNFDCKLVQHSGRSTLHRLNRAEYNNTVRDLFGISITPADKFPQDDVGEGFDNIGDVLSVPPLLMEKYLDAAEEVAAAVVDTTDYSKGLVRTFNASQLSTGSGETPSVDGDGFAVLTTNGTLAIRVKTPSAGSYQVRIEARATQAGEEVARMAVMADRKSITEVEVPGHMKSKTTEATVDLPAGEVEIAAAFLNDFYAPEAPERRRDRNLFVKNIEVIGPAGGGEFWHETHRRFVTARPSETLSTQQAAAEVLRPILRRAFRRSVTNEEVSRFAGLVERTVTEQQASYDYGLYLAIQAILVSPDFLFRVESDPPEGQSERMLNQFEIASRLSYFLWSTMPDEDLLQLAENNRLLDPDVLKAQIERMLKDPKATALGRNFASQWLNLRNLADVRPNPEVFPEFDESLRSAMARESELLFNTVVAENRSIDDFLTADFTFVNERLAKHYGISGVTGEEFARVSLAGTNRSGVLTHAAVLTLTSNPGRTSPVKRGKWILENILGQAPPPAPPGVPALEEAAKDVTGLSLRKRLEIHREDPGCASCHQTMDPLGMGLENFDAVGRWREKDGDQPVDASGDLPTGDHFSGPTELVQILRSRQDQFHRAFAEKLMVYALGRGLQYYDRCAVNEVLERMKQQGPRFSVLVEGIVRSDPFLKRSRSRNPELPVASNP